MVKSLIPAMLIILTLSTGCDALRKLAGRPTSEDIELKRAEIVRVKEAARKQHVADSVALAQKLVADSLAAADSVAALSESKVAEEQKSPRPKLGGQERGTMLNPAALGGLFTTNLDYHYYIIVGAFKERANAEKMVNIVNAAGYTGTMISFRNGLNAVGVCQTDDIDKAFEGLAKAKGESFCPADAWILVNE